MWLYFFCTDVEEVGVFVWERVSAFFGEVSGLVTYFCFSCYFLRSGEC